MKLKVLMGCVIVMGLSGCEHVTPLQANASNVVTTDKVPVTGCRFIQHLSIAVKNGADTAYRSHQDIQQDQMNQLKNSTAQLGGNVFMLATHHTTYQQVSLTNTRGTYTQSNTAKNSDSMVDHHAMAGDAYACDAAAMAQVIQVKPAKQAPQVNDAN